MPKQSTTPSDTVLFHLFNKGAPQWVMQEGAKELNPERFNDFLQFAPEDMTPDQKAITAAHIIYANPSVLDNTSMAAAVDLLDTTINGPLFNALKRHGWHVDSPLQEHRTFDDFSDAKFLETVPLP